MIDISAKIGKLDNFYSRLSLMTHKSYTIHLGSIFLEIISFCKRFSYINKVVFVFELYKVLI